MNPADPFIRSIRQGVQLGGQNHGEGNRGGRRRKELGVCIPSPGQSPGRRDLDEANPGGLQNVRIAQPREESAEELFLD